MTDNQDLYKEVTFHTMMTKRHLHDFWMSMLILLRQYLLIAGSLRHTVEGKSPNTSLWCLVWYHLVCVKLVSASDKCRDWALSRFVSQPHVCAVLLCIKNNNILGNVRNCSGLLSFGVHIMQQIWGSKISSHRNIKEVTQRSTGPEKADILTWTKENIKRLWA
jgi:hypothetical protein